MAELARGTVLDRPWGRTLGALGLRGLSGQLTVTEGAKRYQVAFDRGVIVAATSPLASDAAVRLALTLGLVPQTIVADIARQQAANPGAQGDDVATVAERAKLPPDQAMRLRRRAIAQRAARTFSVDSGEFVVEDRVTLPIVPGAGVDIRTVVYLGAKTLISAPRLDRELGQLGAWFQLKPDAVDDLRQFGFGDAERTLIEPLTHGAGLAELEATGVDQRLVRAAIYALVSCNACSAEMTARAPARRPPPRPAPDASAFSVEAPTVRGHKKSNAPATRGGEEAVALIEARLTALDAGADHFALLGVARDATTAQIRTAYFALARQLHPDRLTALGVADDERRAQRLFAEVNAAFAVLSDAKRRDEYVALLARGGAAAVRAEQAEAEAMAQRVLESEEAFRQGELALRRDQIAVAVRELERAVALNPDEADYQAALAWARFAAAPDKQAIAATTRSILERAIQRSPRAPSPRLYLGRVERILGRKRDAIRNFQEVLRLQPSHPEAASELRALGSA